MTVTDQSQLKTLHTKPIKEASFEVDAILFDMDGTLVDSIGAVEAAWGGVAQELGQDPQEVIDATHGRRAIDNLKDLKPELRPLTDEEMNKHVAEFETKILDNADAFNKEVRSRRQSAASSRNASRRASRSASGANSPFVNGHGDGSQSPSQPPSRSGSISAGKSGRKGSFASELSKRMAMMSMSKPEPSKNAAGTESPKTYDDVFDDDDDAASEYIDIDTIEVDT